MNDWFDDKLDEAALEKIALSGGGSIPWGVYKVKLIAARWIDKQGQRADSQELQFEIVEGPQATRTQNVRMGMTPTNKRRATLFGARLGLLEALPGGGYKLADKKSDFADVAGKPETPVVYIEICQEWYQKTKDKDGKETEPSWGVGNQVTFGGIWRIGDPAVDKRIKEIDAEYKKGNTMGPKGMGKPEPKENKSAKPTAADPANHENHPATTESLDLGAGITI